MKHRIAACSLLSILAGLWLAAPGTASRARLSPTRTLLQEKKDKAPAKKDKAPAAKADINMLALEVMALRGLKEFDPTLEQLKALQTMYKPAFAYKLDLPEAKASATYVKNLRMLRNAYVQNDENAIEDFANKVEVLQEEEEPVVVQELVANRPSAQAAADALRLFTARQVLDVLNAYEDLPEPVSTLMDALEGGIDAKDEDWTKIRRRAGLKAAWLGFGLANPRVIKARPVLAKWLDDKHALKAAELADQRSKLEEELAKIFERVNPALVIGHIAEHDMCLILVNPELPNVLAKRIEEETARLKAEKK